MYFQWKFFSIMGQQPTLNSNLIIVYKTIQQM